MSKSIESEYAHALIMARSVLAGLPFAKHNADYIRGLSGWVFEQILLTRILRALRQRGQSPQAQQQVRIVGRATVDLLIGNIAIEAKVSGAYEDSRKKYRKYRKAIVKKGWHYLYVTLEETYPRNISQAKEVFGNNNAFFLDQPGQWAKLVSRIMKLNRFAEQGSKGTSSR